MTSGRTVLDLVSAQVARTPDAIAAIHGSHSITYAQLDRMSNFYAGVLAARGVGVGARVGICVERGLDLGVVLLAVLKVGAAYVPLDPSYPIPRLEMMVRDSDAELIICSPIYEALFIGRAKTAVFELAAAAAATAVEPVKLPGSFSPASLAYLIYTSGSTGRPKAVALPHAALMNLVEWQIRQPGFTAPARTLQFTPLSFDVHFQEFFCTWSTGGTLVYVEDAIRRDALGLLQLIRTAQIERLFLPFIGLQQLADAAVKFGPIPESLREIVTAGEQLLVNRTLIEFFRQLPQCRLHNQYGPSESHVVTAYTLAGPPAEWPQLPPIGSAIDNVQLWVLNEQLKPVADGESGELFIGGVCLADGYWGREDLTRERFIELALPSGKARVYRTGDLVCCQPDGVVQYLGRIDSQVKIRGHRVEVGEIEAALNAHRAVKDSAVVARDDKSGLRRLITYLVLDPEQLEGIDGLRKQELEHWRALWDGVYSLADGDSDPLFDTRGWDSSFTRELIPKAEMQTWASGVAEWVRAYQPRRLLEIQCGLGLVAHQLAPTCEYYHGIDTSPAAVTQLRQTLPARLAAGACQIEPEDPAAIRRLAEKRFDTVLINAVTQYFVSSDYLLKVLSAAIELVGERGTILLSDVSSPSARRLFFTALELAKNPVNETVADLHAAVVRRCAEDRELLLEPEFFYALRTRFPQLKAVSVQLKPGSYHNELSKFRYDVALEIGAKASTAHNEPSWLDWNDQLSDLSALTQRLDSNSKAAIVVRGIPNARLVTEAHAAARLFAEGAAGNKALWQSDAATETGWEPAAFIALGQASGRRVQLNWTPGRPGCFDAVFAPAGNAEWRYEPIVETTPAASYANQPLNAVCMPLVVKALRDQLGAALPEYMLPARYVLLDRMPMTPSGKLDRRALPEPADARPELDSAYVAPVGDTEKLIVGIWAELLEIDRIGVEDNFFDLGGNSLKAQTCCAQLKEWHGLPVSVTTLYELRTIRRIAAFLEDRAAHEVTAATLHAGDADRHDIAVIGMAGRFPGARTVAELWSNLCGGVDAVTFFDDAELDPSIPDDLRNDPNYVKARGLVPEAEYFDAPFFAMNKREADITDPQQRIFLETAWEAFEDAGIIPRGESPQRIGVYAGVGVNGYYVNNVVPKYGVNAGVGEMQRIIATEKDYVASRVSHKLNLTGPAVAVSTACSTSLVAVIEACMSLRNGFCDLAIAGGASVHTPLNSGYLYLEEGALSPDGHTRSFDQNAAGTSFNGGSAAVVLKPLSQAKADGDRIYAVIRGVGLNNDGTDKASFMAPSVRGQAEAVLQAQRDAGVDARSIGYVEAHGTATPIGDPIEVEALSRAFNANSAGTDIGFCGLGSVKSNVGHLIAAAGVTGLIKACLALKHKQLPPSLHYTAPNPAIDFPGSPFYVVDRLQPWEARQDGTPRRAGVSAFGVGGTNAHVLVEEVAPAPQPTSPEPQPELLLLSARDEGRLEEMTARLATHLDASAPVLAPAAWTLQSGRARFKQRRYVVASDAARAAALLRTPERQFSRSAAADSERRGVVFMFPGQGSQYVGMGQGIYQRFPLFREVVDHCCDLLRPRLPRDLREVMFPAEGADLEAAAALLKETQYTQPALFVIEYALARLWMSWGIQPTALIGHSIGEFVAATLADVFTLEEGLMLVAERARLMQSQPTGAMLAVSAAADTLKPQLPASCDIAAINGPELSVVAGPDADIDALAARWQQQGLQAKRLHTSHAFHSPMMEPAIAPFAAVLEAVAPKVPTIPIMSTVDVAWLTPERAGDRSYWARHLRETVRFADGARELLQGDPAIYLEVGPRNTAATLTAQQMRGGVRQPVLTSLGAAPVVGDTAAEQSALLVAAGELWLSGNELSWKELHAPAARQITSLPSYPFARERHWIDPLPMISAPVNSLAPALNPHESIPSVETYAVSNPADISLSEASSLQASISQDSVAMTPTNLLMNDLREMFSDSSGEDLRTVPADTSFIELGFDSLFLTQAALALKKRYKVEVPFRRMLSDLGDFSSLSAHLAQTVDAALMPKVPVAAVAPAALAPVAAAAALSMMRAPSPTLTSSQAGGLQAVIEQQLQLMARQLDMLSGAPVQAFEAAPAPVTEAPAASIPTAPAQVAAPVAEAAADAPPAKPFGAQTRIDLTAKDDFTPTQRQHFDQLVSEYSQRTAQSKAFTQKHRRHLSDPRVASGFRPAVKELVYPIVVNRSSGSRLWDIDGNEYIDTLCGYGSMYFGYQPDWLVKTFTDQLAEGMEIGPQHPLAGEVAELLTEVLPQQRFAFCNTGSEAVLGALRMARTATGRNKIVAFNGSYHGINDEVIVRGGRNLKSFPASAGIPGEAVQNMIILDYGSDAALDIIREQSEDVAAVIVEVVQSRNPDFLPVEFLHKLRALTKELDIALIFDEVITGFRVAPGGMQDYLGIQSDIGTYGKVIGGGVSLGIIAGMDRYMDTLDGGAWQFGDDSKPEVGVTYFAGTFVRHPLAMAAAKAVLLHMKENRTLHQDVNERAARHVSALNLHFQRVGAPMHIERFASLMYFKFTEDLAFGDLMFADMRRQGIHAWYGRPMFVSAAHTEEDLAQIRSVFMRSLARMQEWGFIPGQSRDEGGRDLSPPAPGAQLGLDADGNPAWFVADANAPGGFRKVGAGFE